MKYIIFLTLFTFSIVSCSKEEKNPKNIILFIGDGMGLTQVTALTTVKDNSNLERFKIGGFLKTHSLSDYVTDSGASATAYATGHRTYNGAISVSVDSMPLKTVLEYAEQSGKSTGLVVTSGITHATPAAFASHVDDRDKYNEIALQMAQSGADVLIGGRLGNFLPQSQDSSFREDSIDVVALLKERMNVALTLKEFQDAPDDKPLAYLYARKSPPKADKRPASLNEMVQKAINILSQNPKGFFLMVEGSQIDWACHDVDQDNIISELLDFDNAVGAGLDFAIKNDETLVIVTADHETGGFALLKGSIEKNEIYKTGFIRKESMEVMSADHGIGFKHSSHTASMVPLFTYGPQAAIFGGIHENNFVGQQIIKFNQ